MEAFERALRFLLRPDIEGGYSDDPHDPGGPTNMGVSLRFASTVGDLDRDGRPDLDVDGDGDVDADDIRRLTQHQAEVVYRELFWRPCKCESLPWPLALQVFDTAVNQGRGPAITILQRAVGVPADGRPGPRTIAAALAADAQRAAIEYQALRNLRYAQTAGFERYGRGWLRRSAKCLAAALIPELVEP